MSPSIEPVSILYIQIILKQQNNSQFCKSKYIHVHSSSVKVIIINVYSSNEKVIMSNEPWALALRCATIDKGYSMLIGCWYQGSALVCR